MTLRLAKKLNELHRAGAVIVGSRPKRSPSLAELEQDDLVRSLTEFLPEESYAYANNSKFHLDQTIQNAKWIWSDVNYHRITPGVEKTFVREIDLTDAYRGTAVAAIAADNACTLYVNGQKVGSCDNFKYPQILNVGSAFKPGKNIIEAVVFNGGDEPTPAGFLGAIEILDGADVKTIVTDSSWLCQSSPAAELGRYNMSPWGFRYNGDSNTYPSFSNTVTMLQEMGIAPDFESTGLVRWIHRIDGAAHVYFIANCMQEPQTASCTFRATGKSVQLWNPYSGKRYRVDDKQESNGRTTILIPFAPSESWFVVFEPEPTLDESNLPPLSGLLKRDTSSVKMIELSRFNVTFNQNAATGRNMESGKEKTVVFETPSDWSKSSDPYIRCYSGQAQYETSFDLDASVLNAKSAVLDLGAVCVMAQIELNGQDLGTLWLAPWTVDVPVALLRQKNNVLKITVANLWCNRLIGDAALPPEQRSTWTSPGGFFGPNDPLQPSGLLSPVRLSVEM